MPFVRRYTNLAGALHLLRLKKMTLLDPASWDDGNDIHFMDCYLQSKKAKTVAALCFAQASETYHHWRVFAPGSDGVCIEFYRSRLEDMFAKEKDTVAGSIRYEKIDALSASGVPVQELPFVKRLPYQDEREWRVVHTALVKPNQFPEFDIRISCKRRCKTRPR